ncbi:MAG: aminoacyl-tRNA hydrolase [Clostridia bacterium]|nr:aminoacyl-tRNA hydrolase [Clostridia bacterium]
MLFNKNKSAYDFLVVGLGNPGLQYEKNRHNAGFMGIDKLAKDNGGEFNKHKFEAHLGEIRIADSRILLAKPQTYMNNSGSAVSQIVSFYKIDPKNIIVLFDDISLDIGNIRIRRKGSAGGHNGIKDIIECLGREDIARIKIGVDKKPHPDYDLKDFVLSNIPKEKWESFETALQNTSKAVEEIVKKGIDSAMNKFSK